MIIFQEAAGAPTPKVIPEPSLTKSFVKNLLRTYRKEYLKLAHSDLLFITDNSLTGSQKLRGGQISRLFIYNHDDSQTLLSFH